MISDLIIMQVETGRGREKPLDAAIECRLPLPSYVWSIRESTVPSKVVRGYESGTSGTCWAADYCSDFGCVVRLICDLNLPADWTVRCLPQKNGHPPLYAATLGIWAGSASTPERALLAAALRAHVGQTDDDIHRCIACGEPLEEGQDVYADADGGTIHAACCGPEPESYVDGDGNPLNPGDPIPPPHKWTRG